MIDPWHIIWNVIYNARSIKSHPPTSPNTATARQNKSHDWSASPMKRHLQCAKQEESSCHFTTYCACHAKWITSVIRVSGASKVTLQTHSQFKIWARNPSIASANIKTIRGQSEDNPTMKSSSCTRRFGDLTRSILETHFVWKKKTCRAPAISQNCTKMLRLQRKITLQLRQILHLPRKMNLMIDPPHLWSVTYTARSNKSHPPTSLNSVRLPRKVNLTIDPPHLSSVIYSEKSPCNFTKYCACPATWISSLIRLTHKTSFTMRGATKVTSQTHQNCACHAKWIAWVIRVTYETSFPMSRATKVTIETHQVLRLPRKMNRMIDPRHIWNVIYNERSK